MTSRRTLLKLGLMTTVMGKTMQTQGATTTGQAAPARGMQVPYSAGRDLPGIRVPDLACDCHHHIYDPVRHPYVPQDVRNQPPATVDAYRMLQRRLGLTRNVIVQPSAYGVDNACTLAALEAMGAAARAVVVLAPSVADAELAAMHRLGVRGIRFNIATGASRDPEAILKLAQRVHELGWHAQFWMAADDTAQMEGLLQRLPCPVVFDHRGHLPPSQGTAHPAFGLICRLLDRGRAWVKLSGLYLDSGASGPGYADTVAVGRAFVDVAPERMVWGTDWPHPSVFSERQAWPDDAAMLTLLAEQAPDETVRNRILVDNPAKLYGF